MNEKWLIGIIICTVIYVFLDFIKDGYKENAIQNGMNEKEAREHYKWKNIFRSIKKTSQAADKSRIYSSTKTKQENPITSVENPENDTFPSETEEENTDESGKNESVPEVSKHLYW